MDAGARAVPTTTRCFISVYFLRFVYLLGRFSEVSIGCQLLPFTIFFTVLFFTNPQYFMSVLLLTLLCHIVP